ncbi:hypothetical protein SRHO_G00053860 [Serrasalmus rhombeus]
MQRRRSWCWSISERAAARGTERHVQFSVLAREWNSSSAKRHRGELHSSLERTTRSQHHCGKTTDIRPSAAQTGNSSPLKSTCDRHHPCFKQSCSCSPDTPDGWEATTIQIKSGSSRQDGLNPSNCKFEGGRLPGVSSLQCSGSQLTREETKDFIWGKKRKEEELD